MNKRRRFKAKRRRSQRWQFNCVECGPVIAVDQDGCCVTCGADATVGPKGE